MRYLLLTALLVVPLVACIPTKLVAKTTELEIYVRDNFDDPQGYYGYGIIQTARIAKRSCSHADSQGFVYLLSGSRCTITNPPQAITLRSTTVFTQSRHPDVAREKAQSPPPSAWRTYTVNTKQVTDEARRLLQTAPSNRYPFGIEATITLHIDENGNIAQTVEYKGKVGNVFS